MNSIDKRSAKRRRTLFGGALYGHYEQAWDCRIIDMSPTGVRLRTPIECDPTAKTFLRISKLNGLFQCEVKWADSGLMGLEFIKTHGVDDMKLNKTLNLLYRIENEKLPKEERLDRLRSVIEAKYLASEPLRS